MVLFNLDMLRSLFEDDTIKRMFFMQESIQIELFSHAVLTSSGPRLALREDRGLVKPEDGSLSPIPEEENSYSHRFSEFFTHFPLDEADCLGAGEIEGFFPPVVMHLKLRGCHGEAKALFFQEPAQMHYELLKAVGVEFLNGEWQNDQYLANFSVDLSKHILAGELSDFSKTGYCNAFFLQHGSIGPTLEAGLTDAARDRITRARELGVQAAERLGESALEKPLRMMCQPPLPKEPFPFGDLVPLGFLLRALTSAASSPAAQICEGLRQLLLDNRQGDLWPFQSGDIATSTDSALVLLGIEDHQAVRALEAFADGHGGYYPQLWSHEEQPGKMVIGDWNRHWCQPDYATTCLARALRQGEGLASKTSYKYLAGGFDQRSGLYFANPYLVDWALALAISGGETTEEEGTKGLLQEKLLAEILASMNEDYTFGQFDLALSTAFAILSLAALGLHDRTLMLAQLRLSELMEPDGMWPEAIPFYSTFKLPDFLPGLSSQAEGQIHAEDQVVWVNGRYHVISLYVDLHKMISTSVATLALAEEPTSTKQSWNETRRERKESHARYRCFNHAEYITKYALPPYTQTDNPNGNQERT